MKNVYALCAMWLLLVGCQEDLSNEVLSSDEITEPVGEAVMLLNSTPELEAIIAKGAKVFQENCNMCHGSPDGYGLAKFGFERKDIVRRAIEHVSPEKAESIADMVEAVREKYALPPANPREDRPFQPGGEVLAGETPRERDFTFLKNELPRWSPTVLGGEADSRELALQIRDEIAAIDFQQMKLGIPLPLWSSDPFHGDDFGTVDEWMSNMPCLAENEEAYREVQQTYLDNPNQSTFMALLEATDKYTSCSDRFKKTEGGHSKNGLELGGPKVARHKYYSQLVADYVFRQQALGNDPMQPDLAMPWMADAPEADLAKGRKRVLTNHIWEIADAARKPNPDPSLASGKYGIHSAKRLLETYGYTEFTIEGQTTDFDAHYLSDQLQTSWFWLNSMFDNERKTDYLIAATYETGYPAHARVRQNFTQLGYFGNWSWSPNLEGKSYYPNFHYARNLDEDFEGYSPEYKAMYNMLELNLAWATLYSSQEYITDSRGEAFDNNSYSGIAKAATAVYLREGNYEKAKEVYYDIFEKSAVKRGRTAAEGRALAEEFLKRQNAGDNHHNG